jgi:DNA-binding NarL/FixJ family response regulator
VQDRQVPLDLFVGRAPELTAVADVITRVEAGQPWLVAIEGEPGMGKTTLARRSLAEATGLTVLSARASQNEADLDFGIAEQLLRAAGDTSAALLLVGGSDAPASSFTVGARLLEVVGNLQAAGAVAVFVDDLQWADRRSVEALTFMLRRLSVDPVLALVTYRGGSPLSQPAQRMLASLEDRLQIALSGLDTGDVAALAAALAAGSLDEAAIASLHDRTLGHPLYLRTILSEGFDFDPHAAGRAPLPRSLAAAIGDHLSGLTPQARAVLEMLAVLNLRLPLAQLGEAVGVGSPSEALEPAVASGLVDWWPEEPTCPVAIHHPLVRDAVYASITPTRRRELHARAAGMVSESAAWEHRVAALEQPDEALAAELEHQADLEADRGHLALAATHLQWASDVSPDRASRERRLLTAALHLMLSEEARGLALREAAEATGSSPLRSCVLGAMAFSTGRLTGAEALFREALDQAAADPGNRALTAVIANRLSGTYTLQGQGEKVQFYARQALETGALDAAMTSQTQTLVAVGASQMKGALAGLAELGHLDPDPARVSPVDVDALMFRGNFRLLTGDLRLAVQDLTASLALVRRGATMTLGHVRACFYLSMAQYLTGEWDDVLLAAEQGFSAASIHSRSFEFPLLHLAACCVPAGRGVTAEADEHARQAEAAAASLDYGQEGLYAAMARALVCQAAGDYLGMADAFSPWQDVELDGRSRTYAVLWRPLMAEGLIGSGQLEQAAGAVALLQSESGQIRYLEPALAWLHGWLAEQRGDPEQAQRIYQAGEEGASTDSPVHVARLLLAHGQLLRRTGHRREAVERLRKAHEIYLGLRAAPFIARAADELAACHLPGEAAKKTPNQSVLALTSRETEVAHLVGKGMSNPEVAAELFISRKAVEYHLGNIYAKCGLRGRQELRRFVEQWRQPAPA